MTFGKKPLKALSVSSSCRRIFGKVVYDVYFYRYLPFYLFFGSLLFQLLLVLAGVSLDKSSSVSMPMFLNEAKLFNGVNFRYCLYMG